MYQFFSSFVTSFSRAQTIQWSSKLYSALQISSVLNSFLCLPDLNTCQISVLNQSISHVLFRSINTFADNLKITGIKVIYFFFSIRQIKCKWPILISSWLPERYLECLQNVGLCLVLINKVIFMLFFLRCRKKMISS